MAVQPFPVKDPFSAIGQSDTTQRRIGESNRLSGLRKALSSIGTQGANQRENTRLAGDIAARNTAESLGMIRGGPTYSQDLDKFRKAKLFGMTAPATLALAQAGGRIPKGTTATAGDLASPDSPREAGLPISTESSAATGVDAAKFDRTIVDKEVIERFEVDPDAVGRKITSTRGTTDRARGQGPTATKDVQDMINQVLADPLFAGVPREELILEKTVDGSLVVKIGNKKYQLKK